MKIKILGSGGCVSLPLPTCQCEVCIEAREKGAPFSRTGCSIFIEDINALIDTPENSVEQLNRENICQVDNIFYSHWDPDHTLGMRIIELLKLRWLDLYIKDKKAEKKIEVYGLSKVINDLKAIKNKYGSYLDYYEGSGLININSVEAKELINIGNIEVYFLPVIQGDAATIFVLREGNKRVIYAPCDIKPFPEGEELLSNADLLIIGNVIPDEPLKDGYVIPKDNILKKELFTMEEVIEIINNYNIKSTIITHIEEDWGKSYLDYKELEKKYSKYNISFAYDGMEILLGD